MAGKVRVEWIVLETDIQENVISEIIGTGVTLDTSGTATSGGDRPTAPAVGAVPAGETYRGGLYARVTSITGNNLATAGANPTATAANGLLIMAGGIELIPIASGHMLSFLELT